MSTYRTTTQPFVAGYTDGPCGSGKTHAVIKLVAEALKNPHNLKNYCYVGVTRDLLAQGEKDFLARGIKPTRIDSDTCDQRIIPEIVRWLRAANHERQVLLITQKAFLALPYFHRRHQDWEVFVDEVPQCDKFFKPRLPRSWRLLTEYLEIGQHWKKKTGILVAKNVGRLRHYLEEAQDECEAAVREIFEHVASKNRLVFVDLASWESMTELAKVSLKDDSKNRIYFLSMLAPEALSGTTIMGANVQKSMLWHWFKKLGGTWVKHQAITKKLRFERYPEEVGRRCHVKYVLTDGLWSKRFRDKEGITYHMDNVIGHWAGDEQFLLVANKDWATELVTLPGCRQISSVCHGLNTFQNYTRMVFLAALNLEGKHSGMLQDLGIGINMQRESIIQAALEQAVMRTALRDPTSTADVEIVVADHKMADFVARALGGAYIGELWDGKDERFRVSIDAAEDCVDEEEAVASCLINAKKKGVIDLYTPRSGVPHATDEDGCGTAPHPSMSMMTHKLEGERRRATCYDERHMTVLEMVAFLKEASQRVRSEKTGDRLFQLTVFNPDAPRLYNPGLLSKANFVSSSGIILDFDGGTLSAEEFVRIFWTDAGRRTKHAFIILNTFSTAPGTNKFRVVMPFNGHATSITEFEAIFDAIVQRLADNGYPARMDGKLYESGLDPASRNPVQSYYLPCINAAHLESAFFKSFGLRRTDEFERYAIKPDHYAELAASPEQTQWMTTPEYDKTDRQQRALEEAAEMKEETSAMHEGRRRPVFDLVGKMMIGGGMNPGEIWFELADLGLDHHVEGALQSWEKYLARGPTRPRSTATASSYKPSSEGLDDDEREDDEPERSERPRPLDVTVMVYGRPVNLYRDPPPAPRPIYPRVETVMMADGTILDLTVTCPADLHGVTPLTEIYRPEA